MYPKIYSLGNLIFAWRAARKGKTKKDYVKEFEKDLVNNLVKLKNELKHQTYRPEPLETFIIRDPKTRTISKSSFRDRIVHHAIIQIIGPILESAFIYDSCANRKGKGTSFALKRFDHFTRKVSRNGILNGWLHDNQVKGYAFKADIRHYFDTVDHAILVNLIKKKIADEMVISLIKKILENATSKGIGMPLGNLTSQFFANVYLNDLDHFIKHELRAKHYLRYVDDFIIFHSSRGQLQQWREQIELFLANKLHLHLHPEKSKILPIAKGIDFLGFRNFYYFRLLRKRNIRAMKRIMCLYNECLLSYKQIESSFYGWQAYAKVANTYILRKRLVKNCLYLLHEAVVD